MMRNIQIDAACPLPLEFEHPVGFAKADKFEASQAPHPSPNFQVPPPTTVHTGHLM